MNQESEQSATIMRPFWKWLLIVIGIDSLIVLFGSLLLGDFGQISNLYFWSSFVLFVVAVIPIVTEIGGSAKIASRAVRKGENVSQLTKKKQLVYEQRANITYVFGVAGILSFFLSLITSMLI